MIDHYVSIFLFVSMSYLYISAEPSEQNSNWICCVHLQESPLEIYKCISYCPGGRPGTCAANRTGVTCGDCPKFEFVQDDTWKNI